MGSSNKATARAASVPDVAGVAGSKGPEGAIDPRTLMRKPVRARTGDNKYPSLQRAMDLATALDVTPTYERIRLLARIITGKPPSSPSSTTSLEVLRANTTCALSREPTPGPSQGATPLPSRSPSPSCSGGVISRPGTPLNMNDGDTSEEEGLFTPRIKRQRTLKERMELTLEERITVGELRGRLLPATRFAEAARPRQPSLF